MMVLHLIPIYIFVETFSLSVAGSKEPEHQEKQFCACWCQGWAEIYVRRPTGKHFI